MEIANGYSFELFAFPRTFPKKLGPKLSSSAVYPSGGVRYRNVSERANRYSDFSNIVILMQEH